MAKSTQHNLTLSATDKASRPVYEMYKRFQKEGKALANNERQRRMLGIRGEREIQAELLRTQRAYQQLARSGKLSSDQLTRAKNAELKKIRELNTEMGRGQQLSRGQRFKSGIGTAMAVGGGLYMGARAASRLVMDPVRKVYDEDKSIKAITKTAYGGEDVAGLQKGEQHIRNLISEAQIKYKATNAQILEALDGAFTEGFEIDNIESVLPVMLKMSVGSGANAQELGGTVQTLVNNGYKPENVEKSLNQMVASGTAGSYEVTDMASALPRLLTASKATGNTTDHLPQTLAAMQVLKKTSGSSSLAETQYLRLMSEIKDANFGKRLSEFSVLDNGKRRNVDWEATRVKGAQEGKSTEEAIISTLSKILEADPKLKKYKEGLESKDMGIREQAVIKIMESGILAKIFGSDVAASGAIGLLQQKDMYKEQVQAIYDSGSIIDTNYAYETESSEKQFENLGETFDRLRNESLKPLSEKIGELSKVLSDWMNQNPELTKKGVQIGTGVAGAGMLYGGVKASGAIKSFLTGSRALAPLASEVSAASAMASGGSGVARSYLSALKGSGFFIDVEEIKGLAGNSINEITQMQQNRKVFDEKYGEGSYKAAQKRYGLRGVFSGSRLENQQQMMREYEEIQAIEQEYGADKAQSVYNTRRPYMSLGGDWRNADPATIRKYLEQSQHDERSIKRYQRPLGKDDVVIDENGNEQYQSSSAAFQEAIISMSHAIDAMNPLADLPRQLEMLQNAVPKEVVVNMPVSLDGRVLYESVERVMISQLNRGA